MQSSGSEQGLTGHNWLDKICWSLYLGNLIIIESNLFCITILILAKERAEQSDQFGDSLAAGDFRRLHPDAKPGALEIHALAVLPAAFPISLRL